jgi:HK97 family phage prohead protease
LKDLELGAVVVKAYRPRLEFGTAGMKAGEFLARVAVFNNVDRFGDRILPGAFTESLATWKASGAAIPVIYQHAWGEPPIGEVTEAAEDEQGLVVRASLYAEENEIAKKVLHALRRKSLTEFSFAFETKAAGIVFENDEAIREIKTLDLVEVGPCLRGVNPETELIAVKSRLLGRKAGRTLSAATLERLRGLAAELVEFCDAHDKPAEAPPADDGKARAMNAQWIASRRFALALTNP